MRFENPIQYVQKFRANPIEANQHLFFLYDARRNRRIATTTVVAEDAFYALREATLRIGQAGLRIVRVGPAIQAGNTTIRYLFVEPGKATVFPEEAIPQVYKLGPIPLAEVAAVVTAPPAIVPQPPMPPPPPLKIRTSSSRQPPPLTLTPPEIKPKRTRKKASATSAASPPSPARGTAGERSRRKKNPPSREHYTVYEVYGTRRTSRGTYADYNSAIRDAKAAERFGEEVVVTRGLSPYSEVVYSTRGGFSF